MVWWGMGVFLDLLNDWRFIVWGSAAGSFEWANLWCERGSLLRDMCGTSEVRLTVWNNMKDKAPFIEKAKKKSIWKWIIHILVQFFEKKAALNFEQLGLSETCVPWNRLETHIIIRIISRPWDIPWYTPILDTSNWIWLLRTDMTSARLRHIMLKFQDVFFWDRREVNHDNRKWEREGSYGSPKKMKKQ